LTLNLSRSPSIEDEISLNEIAICRAPAVGASDRMNEIENTVGTAVGAR